MLNDLDKTITQLLKSSLPRPLAETLAVTFATPAADFPPPSVALPAVNFFLYSATPNVSLRENAPTLQFSPNGTAARVRPPVYLDCTYLVSVWPSAAVADPSSQEHEIFGEVMKALLAAPRLPEETLQGRLQHTQSAPVAGKVSSAETLGSVWQTFNLPTRLALSYKVTFSMPLFDAEPVTLVTDKQIRIEVIAGGAPS